MNHTFNPLNVLRGLSTLLLILAFSGCGEINEVPDAACRYPGKISCACLPDDTCYQSANGLQMLCQEGQCVEPVCADDNLQKGCLCADGQQCEGELICINGNCVDDTGQTREAPANPICYTPCRGNGLAREDGTFSSCDSDGLMRGCLTGSTCVDGTCKAPEPVVAPEPASQQPAGPTPCVSNGDCQSDERCVDGLCSATGCQADDGCTPGQTCESGMCVDSPQETPADEKPDSHCEVDDECPPYQACIENRCYSDCDTTDDCNGTRECVRHVCRLPCSPEDAPACTEGSCETINDATYCMPDGVPATGPVAPNADVDLSDNNNLVERVLSYATDGVTYGLTQSREANAPTIGFRGFDFAPTAVGGQFLISNHGTVKRSFLIRKKSHTEYTDAGPVVVEEGPLHWVTMGVGEPAEITSADTTRPTNGMDNADMDNTVDLNGNMDGARSMDTAAPTLERVAEVEIEIPPNQAAIVYLGDVKNDTLSRWDGELIIEVQKTHATKVIPLSFTGSAEGHWAGQMHSFANFNDKGLAEWQVNQTRTNLQLVSNAFVRRWVAFKEKRLSLDEFKAMVNATVTGSWNFASVRNQCPNAETPNENVGCYLYDNPAGIAIYSDALPAAPIPTGVVSLPFEMMVKATEAEKPGAWTGRVDSRRTLQYLGDPQIELEFGTNPNDCSGQPVGTPCVIPINKMNMTSTIGGRYAPTNDDNCSRDGYAYFPIPWLVEGFLTGTSSDGAGGRVMPDCRDTVVPFDDPQSRALNAVVAQANPVPDGQSRVRQLEMIDGVMVDQKTMYVIYRETFPSFLGEVNGFSSYGLLELQRSNNTVSDEEYVGNEQTDTRETLTDAIEYCEPLFPDLELDESSASLYALALVKGFRPSAEQLEGGASFIAPGDDESIHYLCADTGFFDGGSMDDGTAEPEALVSCPAGSKIIYFNAIGLSQSDIAAEPCQISAPDEPGTCMDTLNSWLRRDAYNIKDNAAYTCVQDSPSGCDDNRLDLREGKKFFSRHADGVYGQSVDTLIADAFRYKVKFRSRSGGAIGFTPDICVPNSNAIPYCYSPKDVEDIESRVDCATFIYTHYYDELAEVDGVDTRQMLKTYLSRNYAYLETTDANNVRQTFEGFELLFAELLIMLGDESYTNAFQSRFDLAGQNLSTFEGSKFEVNGIDLTGGAGFEMVSLYKATQYYQKTLDRFYKLSPLIAESFRSLPDGQGFITAESVTSYFAKLIKASSQKARAWSEISKKYQRVNEPELARQVVERAYVAAYLEGVILAQLMLRTIEMPNSSTQAQIESEVNKAQLTYQAALMDMQSLYKDISDDITFFGIPPDYIPFPAMYELDKNAFYKLLELTQQKMNIAAGKEDRALADNRAFETDSASFQSELFNIAKQYEDQLAQICGTFQGADGTVYPAIKKYAEQSDVTRQMGDPCGSVGNGAIFEDIIQISLGAKDLDMMRLKLRNLDAEMNDAKAKMAQQCGRIEAAKNVRLQREGAISDWNVTINTLRGVIGTIDKSVQTASTLAQFAKCSLILGVASGGSCPMAGVAGGMYMAAAIPAVVAGAAAEAVIIGGQRRIDDIQQSVIADDYDQQCDAMKIDTTFMIKDLFRRQAELMMELGRLIQAQKLSASSLEKHVNESKRLQGQQTESEQLSINVQAARNDPNVRIYRNDAVIAADRTFYNALVAAYKLTKIYEYYTSQSYPDIIKLELSRMIAYGDYSLEEYVSDLEQEYYVFEETFGVPDLRQEIISLKKDIFNITELSANGTGAAGTDMTAAFTDRLTNPNLLNDKGYVVIPFSTNLATLSPLTRNHKIESIEVNVLGAGAGDRLGRVYIRQTGTGVISTVTDSKTYFALPERTAVINYSSKGDKPNEPNYYKNIRLKDRPFVNTSWELVINTKDEAVNKDMDLTRLTDIKIFVYYNDFTVY